MKRRPQQAGSADPREPVGRLDAVLERRAEFRLLDPAEQLRQLRGTRVERTFTVDRENGIDEAKRTVWMSIASEQGYERWWGIEILDMNPSSIRLDRMKSGAALLVGHDTSDQVGVVENYEITGEKKLRVLARFGKSARAEEIFRDVLDGIRRNTSVGYIIHDLVLEKQEEDVSTYRVTDWEPFEGSLVPVPADPTVGVGRALDPSANPSQSQRTIMDEKEKARIEAETRAKVEAEFKVKQEAEARERAEATARAANTPEAVATRENERVTGLLAAGDEYKDLGGPELARELLKDKNATLDTFKARMLEKMRGKQTPTHTAQPGTTTPYGTAGRHIILRGQKLRAFTQPLRFTDGSTMDAVECAYRSGQWLLATIGQNVRAQRWCKDHGLELRVMTTDVDSAGGYVVPDEMEQSVIDLREAYGLARRLARRRPMASDTKSIPKRTGGITAYFVNEDNSGVTASDKAWGNVNFVAKTLAALSLISKNLEDDSVIDVVDDLAREMAWAFSQKEDQCWLIGDGTSTYGGMTGLITLFEASALASRFNAATNHDTFAEFDNSDLTSTMGVVADFAGLNPSWVVSKTFAESVFGRLKATAGGVTGQGLEMRQRYGYGGYDADTSEIMRKDPTADVSDVVVALFGDFAQSSSFGDRRGITVEVLRERYAEKLQVGVLAHERFHIVNHDVGTTAVKGPVAALYGD